MIGVYVHIPFCERKCSYCDFYSIANDSRIDDFIFALCNEIRLVGEYLGYKPKVDTIFFGGGTPSKLSVHHLERILNQISLYFDLSLLQELTLECNPGTELTKKLSEYKRLGVNRISIGVQSFNDAELAFLERIHNSEEAFSSIKKTLDFGFDNVNVDIMFSIPNQTAQSLQTTICKLLELEPPHISAYSLMYEEGTPLFIQLKKGKVRPVDEDTDFKFFELIHYSLVKAGYEHYEVSNFSKNGKYCKHNLRYWNRLEYIGFGPSAHSFSNEQRYWNVRNLNQYIDFLKRDVLPIDSREEISRNQKITERIMLGLRSVGIDLQSFQDEFGIDLNKVASEIFRIWEEKSLARKNKNKIKLNHYGYFLCDSLTLELLNQLNI